MLRGTVRAAEVTQQVTQQVLKLLTGCDWGRGRSDLMHAIGIRDRVSFSLNYLEPSLSDGLIEMTIASIPSSRLQKYRLTDKGRALLDTSMKAVSKA
jgi:ATP-dependent DNA helicase RecG